MKVKEEWFEDPTNLVDMLENTIAKFPKRNSIGQKNSAGEYEFIKYDEIGERIDNLRGGLASLGVDKNDAVGIIMSNSIEWAVIAFATFGRVARFVPMYEKELEKVWKYIIKDSGLKVLFVVNDEIYEKVKNYPDEIETLEKIIKIKGSGLGTLKELEEIGNKNKIPSTKPHWSDIAVLIYTSGTTGNPKGVLLSHGNFTTNIQAAAKNFPGHDENSISLSILPWAHSFGQTGELYLGMYMGASTGIMGSVETVADDMLAVRPTILLAVPRIFNRIYAGVHNLIKEKGGVSEFLFNLAKKEALKKRETGSSSIILLILDKLVFSKIRARFGGRLKLAITGSAAMNPEIANFFNDIGIPTYDCYGLTETSPAMTMNTPAATRLGSVGRAIEKVTVVIDKSLVGEKSEDGEIVCFGPNVMQGYHNKPEQTAKVLFEDPELGIGFRTGDRGRLDDDGFLYITGRFKEEYKLQNGKYVHPASIEEDIKLNEYVANVMLYGEGQQHNVALIIPDFDALNSYAKSVGLTFASNEELVKNEKISNFIKDEIDNQLKDAYGNYEIPKKIVLCHEDFSVDNGMLTQTLKLKRRNVLEKYGDDLLSLYDDDDKK